MLLDACHYARGKFQGGAASLTVDARLAAVTHRFHKGFQFSAQRLDRWRGQLLIREFRLWGRFFRGDAQGVAPGVIERNVLVLLEKAHLAHALGRYAARGHIGHRASLKFQASVRDIDFVRQHRDSDRLHFRDRLLYQGEQDVEVVDHQVVDHVDIEAARRKHTQPVHLEKERMIQNRLDRQHRWVESFDVADLQQALMPLCRVQQRIRLRQSLRHGLLDQNIEAHFHKAAANLSMLGGGHGHADGIGSAAQLVERGEGMGPKFGGGSLRAFSAFVEDADQFGVLNFAVNARVIPPEFTGSDNSDTYLSRLRCRRHSLFIPAAVCFGSAVAAARGTAWIAIPASFASSINFVRSNSKVRPASTTKAVACAFFMCSMVGRPITGTSKRMSCPGLLTFTTTSGFPAAIRAARAMVSSVPSIASTATHAQSEITTVWPMSRPEICRATPRPYAMSAASRASGARRVSTPASGTRGFRNRVESTSRIPSSSKTRATAPISASVFLRGRERSSLASFQSGRIALKILLCFT